MRTSARISYRFFSALVFVAVAGCRDAVPPTGTAADPRPALTLAADGTLRDDGIDPRDTYFAFNVTTTRTTYEGDAPDGLFTATESEYPASESAYLEAGFGTDG